MRPTLQLVLPPKRVDPGPPPLNFLDHALFPVRPDLIVVQRDFAQSGIGEVMAGFQITFRMSKQGPRVHHKLIPPFGRQRRTSAD